MKTTTLSLLALAMLSISSCSNDVNELEETNKTQYEEYEVSFPALNIDTLSAGDSINFTTMAVSTNLSTRASNQVQIIGTVKSLGNKKTYWKWNKGLNIVPISFTTRVSPYATFSEVFEIMATIDFPNSDFIARGYTGEKSGFYSYESGKYADQIIKQENNQSDENLVMKTYIYRLVSTMSGAAPKEPIYVPRKIEETRLYYRVGTLD